MWNSQKALQHLEDIYRGNRKPGDKGKERPNKSLFTPSSSTPDAKRNAPSTTASRSSIGSTLVKLFSYLTLKTPSKDPGPSNLDPMSIVPKSAEASDPMSIVPKSAEASGPMSIVPKSAEASESKAGTSEAEKAEAEESEGEESEGGLSESEGEKGEEGEESEGGLSESEEVASTPPPTTPLTPPTKLPTPPTRPPTPPTRPPTPPTR